MPPAGVLGFRRIPEQIAGKCPGLVLIFLNPFTKLSAHLISINAAAARRLQFAWR